jgi:hypothetical protein
MIARFHGQGQLARGLGQALQLLPGGFRWRSYSSASSRPTFIINELVSAPEQQAARLPERQGQARAGAQGLRDQIIIALAKAVHLTGQGRNAIGQIQSARRSSAVDPCSKSEAALSAVWGV